MIGDNQNVAIAGGPACEHAQAERRRSGGWLDFSAEEIHGRLRMIRPRALDSIPQMCSRAGGPEETR